MKGNYTPKVLEAITRRGSRLAYEEAQEEIKMMWGVSLSKSAVRKMTIRHGQVANRLIDKRVEALHQGEESSSVRPEKLMMSADGAMILTTSGEWKEVKTVAFGEYETIWDAKREEVQTKTGKVSYFSRIEEASKFGESAVYEWDKRGGEQAKEVVVVNDGAVWIQAFIDYHCPQAKRVIDFAHAQGYIAKIGKLIYGAESEEFRSWYRLVSKQLGRKPPQRTLSDLRFLRNAHQEHPNLAEIDQAIRYLERRQDMIDYPHFRKQRDSNWLWDC
jgi:hypothetical protein